MIEILSMLKPHAQQRLQDIAIFKIIPSLSNARCFETIPTVREFVDCLFFTKTTLEELNLLELLVFKLINDIIDKSQA